MSKIFNDPVHGFIHVSNQTALKILNHPWFQRLRRISQLGLSHYVYPGAVHNRFIHALGAYHLMDKALNTLDKKGVFLMEEERTAGKLAILMHDIGHGPFSHALENTILDVHHEDITKAMLMHLNEEFRGGLEFANEIFNKKSFRPFLHQLVSGQLDVDRMDYLSRDSFYSGVSEGVIGYDRILEMLNVVDGNLVVEEKAIYSIEKFLVARRLMYWQVYLHKTVISAEMMLLQTLRRVKYLADNNLIDIPLPSLKFLIEECVDLDRLYSDKSVINNFVQLDDGDLMQCFKLWQDHEDVVLKTLSYGIVNRELLKIKISSEPFEEGEIEEYRKKVKQKLKLDSVQDAEFLVFTDSTSNMLYNQRQGAIQILRKNGEIKSYHEISDQMNISTLEKPVTKYFLCYVKE